jgi:hypothetical protein
MEFGNSGVVGLWSRLDGFARVSVFATRRKERSGCSCEEKHTRYRVFEIVTVDVQAEHDGAQIHQSQSFEKRRLPEWVGKF